MRLLERSCRWPLILVCLWLITLTGIRSIPIEDHEVFVVQTTREMETRGDWVLPSFNYEPRLQKPPFNYWATAAVSRLDPTSSEAQVWHGRLISLLAGLALVLATYRVGSTFYGPTVGKLASLLLLSMQGYANLTHNARPDFLYATLGVLQLYAWMYAWKAEDGTWRQRIFGWLGWGMAGLATLTKGPQLPAVFLAGTVLFLAVRRVDRRRMLKVLRPFVGLALCAAIVLPWWLLLQQRLDALQVDLSQTQLSGSLLKNLASWKEILSFYYPLTLFSLMLPASFLLPFLLRRMWRDRAETAAATRLQLYAGAVLLVVFTLGGHYRKHYLLPLLPLGALCLASAVSHAGGYSALKGWAKRIVMGLIGAVAIGCVVSLILEHGYAALAWMALVAVPLAMLLRAERQDPAWEGDRLATQWMKATVVLILVVTGYIAYFPSSQDRWRRTMEGFAEGVGETLRPDDTLIQWKSTSFILPLYARRPVARFDDPAAFEAWLKTQPADRAVYVVVPTAALPDFATRYTHQVISAIDHPRHPSKSLVLARLTRASAGPG